MTALGGRGGEGGGGLHRYLMSLHPTEHRSAVQHKAKLGKLFVCDLQHTSTIFFNLVIKQDVMLMP